MRRCPPEKMLLEVGSAKLDGRNNFPSLASFLIPVRSVPLASLMVVTSRTKTLKAHLWLRVALTRGSPPIVSRLADGFPGLQ